MYIFTFILFSLINACTLANDVIEVEPEPYTDFLRAMQKATEGQILFRSDAVFSGDSAYNRLFELIVLDTHQPDMNLGYHTDTLNKLSHIWNNYIICASQHANTLIQAVISKKDNDNAERKIMLLQASQKTIKHMHDFLYRWGTTLISLYEVQLACATELGLTEWNHTIYKQSDLENVIRQLNHCNLTIIGLIIDRTLQKQMRCTLGDKERDRIPTVSGLPLNQVTAQKPDTTAIPKRLPPARKRLLRTMSRKLLGGGEMT